MFGKEARNRTKRRHVAGEEAGGRPQIQFNSLDPSDINQLQKVYPKIIDDLKESFSRLKSSQFAWRMAKTEERQILRNFASLMPLVTVKSSIFLLRGLQPTIFTTLFEHLPLTDPWIIENAPDCHFALIRLAMIYSQTHDQFFSTGTNFGSFANASNSSAITPHQCSSFEQLTNKYFGQILITMSNLLHQFHRMKGKSHNLVIDWLQRLSLIIGNHLHSIKKIREMFTLSSAMLELLFHLHEFKFQEQRKQFVKCIYRLQAFNLLLQDEHRCRQLTSQFVHRLMKSASQLNFEQFRLIWTRIPTIFLIKLFGLIDLGQKEEEFAISTVNSKSNLSALLSLFESSQPQLGQNSMEAFEFQTLANFLFERKIITIMLEDSTVQDWIPSAGEFFYNNLNNNDMRTENVVENKNQQQKFDGKMAVKIIEEDLSSTLPHWHFAIGQFALFCIANRMRTPIGQNPVETFTKFEKELRSLVTQIALRELPSQPNSFNLATTPNKRIAAENESNKTSTTILSGSTIEEEEAIGNPSPEKVGQIRELRSEEEWFRVRMLLQSVDCIDKLMVYAVRGSMLEIAADIPLNSRQFFLINQVSCTDWLSRTALPLMGVAFSSGNYAQIVRMAGFIFAELERKNLNSVAPIRLDSSTLFTICWLVRALVELGAPQAIRGVQQWARQLFGSTQQSFEWCKFAELLAGAHVEEALDGFLAIQQQQRTIIGAKSTQMNGIEGTDADGIEEEMPKKMHNHIVNAVEELAWRAASTLRDPQIEQRLHEAYLQKRIAITGAVDEPTNEAQKKFKRLQWQRVLALSSWDRLGQNAMIENSGEQQFLPWEFRGRLLDTEAQILHLFELRQRKEYGSTMQNYGRMNTSEALFALQDEISDEAKFLLMASTERADGLDHARRAFLHSLCTGIQHLNQPKGGGNYVKQQYGGNQQMRSPIKQQMGQNATTLPILLEINLGELLRDWKSETLHRLELGQIYCSWMERLYGGQKEQAFILRKMHTDMAQLAQQSGNARLAALHFRLAGINSTNLFNGPPNEYSIPQSTFDALQFNNAFSGSQATNTPPPPGFAGSTSLQQQHFISGGQMEMMFPGYILNNFADGNLNQILEATGGTTQHCLLSEEFDGDTLKLLPAEVGTMLQYGINMHTQHGSTLEKYIGICGTYEEFCTKCRQTFAAHDMMAAPILISLEQQIFQQFWLTIKHRQYRLYELALNSHLRFLENLFPGKSHVQTMEVILRLLKMMGRQPDWFVRIVSIAGGGDMNAWMDRIAIDVWTGIIPQLFIYLSHPTALVREIVSLLLDKIGHISPHLICYPAIVLADRTNEKGRAAFSDDLFNSIGMNLKKNSGWDLKTVATDFEKENNDFSIKFGQKLHIDEDEDGKMESSTSPSFLTPSSLHLFECCHALVNSLAGSHPKLVAETKAFCRALQKIALLHEEQWLYALSQFDQQIGKLIRMLPKQQTQSAPTTATLQKRVATYLNKAHSLLQTLYNGTCGAKEFESENERQFAESFGDQIDSALAVMEEQNLAGNAQKAWEPFKKILFTLNKQAMKRSALCLNVSKMSPYLDGLNSTAVPMPGQEQRPFSELITVQKMTKIAYVLPTKTRPKKIAFIGSDGKTYTFLFKGQENLYMDAALMQILHLCNTIFMDVKNQRQMDICPAYRCVTYSVTPLGQRSGLIQWVDGAVPLFQIYRKWRVNQHKFLAEIEENKQQKLAANLAQQQKNAKGGKQKAGGSGMIEIEGNKKADQKPQQNSAEPERPIEHFYNKLKTLLAASGKEQQIVGDRQRWPPKLVKQVLNELIGETPRDILAKEIWMHAGTSATWWKMTQQFARTAAIGSMLGALIGLGDRHLDNVLMNLHTGQLIHVDYNICFDKGRSLRVPEMVPFRLTGNIVQALGPTKIEGIFRQSCEYTMEMLRADCQLVVQLLRTFKIDPLLDFGFLQSTSDMAKKSRYEIADAVANRIHRKLQGHELMYTKRATKKDGNGKGSEEQQPARGMFKLAVLAQINPTSPELGDSNDENEEAKKANEKQNIGNVIQCEEVVETKQMNVAEQVDFLINESMDLGNLALMYEGWTAWV